MTVVEHCHSRCRLRELTLGGLQHGALGKTLKLYVRRRKIRSILASPQRKPSTVNVEGLFTGPNRWEISAPTLQQNHSREFSTGTMGISRLSIASVCWVATGKSDLQQVSTSSAAISR